MVELVSWTRLDDRNLKKNIEWKQNFQEPFESLVTLQITFALANYFIMILMLLD